MPCFLSTLQSPIQAFLRPAVWIPGLNRLHSHREQWVAMSGTAEQLTEELVQAVDKVAEADQRTTYAVSKVDRDKHRVQVYNWTKAEWLDVVEIEFRDGANGGVEAKCFSFSSGFLPTWFPLCFLINSLLFFIPFYDNKFNSERLERLRTSMTTECRLVPKTPLPQNETTPILSKASPAEHRAASPVATGHGTIATGHSSIATGQYQETASPTKADPSPAVLRVDAEQAVPTSEPAASADDETEAPGTEASIEQTSAPMDTETHKDVASTDPVVM